MIERTEQVLRSLVGREEPWSALVQGVEGSEGEVCKCSTSFPCPPCTFQEIDRQLDTPNKAPAHSPNCAWGCGGTGRIGARKALSGLLMACREHREYNFFTLNPCYRCGEPYRGKGGWVLHPTLRDLLAAGEELAVVGMFEERLLASGVVVFSVRKGDQLEVCLAAIDVVQPVLGCGLGPYEEGKQRSLEALLSAIERAAQERV